MSFLSQLPSIVFNRPKRRGRGYGSGKGGHTSGRGSKGHKARGLVSVIFTGTKHKKSLWQRLPAFKGRKFFGAGLKTITVNFDKVSQYIKKDNQEVDLTFLLKHKIVSRKQAKTGRIKLVLGRQKPTRPIKLKVKASQSLIDAIAKLESKPKLKKTKAKLKKKSSPAKAST